MDGGVVNASEIRINGSVVFDGAGAFQGPLPFDGLSGISNGTLTNELFEVFSSAQPEDIPSASVTGVASAISVPSVDNVEYVEVAVAIDHPDMSRLRVRMEDPDGTLFTLIDEGDASGTQLRARFPSPDAVAIGDLSTWDGRDPQGTWILRVVDQGGTGGIDGQLLSWSVNAFATLGDRVRANGTFEVTDELYVDAATWLRDDVQIGGNLNVDGTTTVGDLVVTGAVTLPDGSGLVPTGALMAFNLDACPTGWSAADGGSGRPDLRGRFPIGAGPLFQDTGTVIARGDSGGSHRWRVGRSSSGQVVEAGNNYYYDTAIRFEFLGESAQAATYGSGTRWSPYANHLPPYYGVLYCVKD